MSKFKIELWYDQDSENPCEWGQWELVSFNRNHINFEDPYELLKPINQFGEVYAKEIGLQRKFDCETAFLLSCYTHGESIWSLRGEGMQCRFDTATTAGILYYRGDLKHFKKEDREKMARSFLETYSYWANGNCYGFTIFDEDDDAIECCGGFVGTDKYIAKCIAEHLSEGDEIEITGEASWVVEKEDIIKNIKKGKTA